VSGYNYAATTKRVGVVKNWVKNLKNVNILKWTSTTFTSPFLIQSLQKFSLKGIIQGLSNLLIKPGATFLGEALHTDAFVNS
jgi:hypothetical protein